MTIQTNDGIAHPIRTRVLQALQRNRTPGYHFAGNFFIRSFEQVAPEDTRLVLDADSHCTDANGQIDIAVLALFADIALAASLRAGVDRSLRLATVSLNLHLNGLPARGTLEAMSSFQGYVQEVAGKQGLSRVSVRSGTDEVAFGSGSFMVLPSPPGAGAARHPMPSTQPGVSNTSGLTPADLSPIELDVLQRAEQAIAQDATLRGSFISRFLGIAPVTEASGASCLLMNGPHIANRVGHVQGGILTGLAATTAQTALHGDWRLAGLSAWFIRPGDGPWLKATASVLHQGRLTAVVRTQIQDSEGRLVMEVVTNHACANSE